MPSMARLVSLAILTTLIIFLGITFYQIVAPFLLPLFLAAVTSVWCQPLYGYFLRKFKQRDWLAAGATIATVCLALFVPMAYGVISATLQLKQFVVSHDKSLSDDDAVTPDTEANGKRPAPDRGTANELESRIREVAGKAYDLIKPPPPETATVEERERAQAERDTWINELTVHAHDASKDAGVQLRDLARRSLAWAASGGWGLTTRTFGLLGALAGAFVGLGMFLIAFYYFLTDGSKLMTATEKLIPVQVDYQRQLIHEFNRVMQSVVSATMLSAIAQGAATALALYIVGIHQFFLIFVVATFASLIPVAGTWMVWGPFAIWFCIPYEGHLVVYWKAVFLVIVGVGVIGTMDNFIKAYMLKNDTSLHPLLAFVSVFGGMQVMGLWGIFVGPVVACCLHALIKIFNEELSEFSKERFAKVRTPEEPPPPLGQTSG